ncbi:hypothetical protein [Actinoplanes sp. NBRC 101535]|uniref:phage tail tube protein n=1 Tax=Actinoplanes sp. NBRC 101535 TaxID=3032196 RepID=UPI0024A2B751|nr:hypothetical protein [Actinoplanes sp. NBRC 101535]GLY08271.1 hypothetical protein Acsp01_86500 [Actinoplanes sp. NBRC 101535]
MSQPMSVTTNGTVAVVFVPTIADLEEPSPTEISAVGSLDVSCYLAGDNALNTETTESNVEDPRLCSKKVFEQPGDSTDTLEWTYVFNPDSPADNEAELELVAGRKGFVVMRWGIDADQAFAAGDIVDVFPVILGVQRRNNPSRNSVHRITQKCFVTGEVIRNAVVTT